MGGAGVPEPRTAPGRAGLDAILADAAGALVALDFDGTLAPIVDDPDQAYAHPGAVTALRRLAAYMGTIAVVTGRPAQLAAERTGLVGADGLDGVVVLGQYGVERWDGATGAVTAPPPPPAVEQARAALPDLLQQAGAPDGTWVEDKGRALAVHTRRTADPQGALDLLTAPLRDLADRLGLHAEPGRFVLELRSAGMDKGAAVTSFVAERAARSVLYGGDDLGDLSAYDAVDALRERGTPGVKVCSGSAEVTALAERADLVVAGPDGVVALLDELAGALETAGRSG